MPKIMTDREKLLPIYCHGWHIFATLGWDGVVEELV